LPIGTNQKKQIKQKKQTKNKQKKPHNDSLSIIKAATKNGTY
jgi:hypothetical protein